jgi:hypothetical protein
MPSASKQKAIRLVTADRPLLITPCAPSFRRPAHRHSVMTYHHRAKAALRQSSKRYEWVRVLDFLVSAFF